jgi:ketosteroid isomerase-like protein
MRINKATLFIAIAGALLLSFSLFCKAAELVQASQPSSDEQGFLAALTAADAAQRGLQSGNAAVYKAIWSRSDDATLIGGFGGGVEKGWERVSQRIDWVATQFTNGTNTIERLVTHSDGKLGYVVQIEHLRFQVPGQAKESTRDYRVTMLFQKEPEGWKLLHRHADSQMMKQAP